MTDSYFFKNWLEFDSDGDIRHSRFWENAIKLWNSTLEIYCWNLSLVIFRLNLYLSWSTISNSRSTSLFSLCLIHCFRYCNFIVLPQLNCFYLAILSLFAHSSVFPGFFIFLFPWEDLMDHLSVYRDPFPSYALPPFFS